MTIEGGIGSVQALAFQQYQESFELPAYGFVLQQRGYEDVVLGDELVSASLELAVLSLDVGFDDCEQATGLEMVEPIANLVSVFDAVLFS